MVRANRSKVFIAQTVSCPLWNLVQFRHVVSSCHYEWRSRFLRINSTKRDEQSTKLTALPSLLFPLHCQSSVCAHTVCLFHFSWVTTYEFRFLGINVTHCIWLQWMKLKLEAPDLDQALTVSWHVKLAKLRDISLFYRCQLREYIFYSLILFSTLCGRL